MKELMFQIYMLGVLADYLIPSKYWTLYSLVTKYDTEKPNWWSIIKVCTLFSTALRRSKFEEEIAQEVANKEISYDGQQHWLDNEK